MQVVREYTIVCFSIQAALGSMSMVAYAIGTAQTARLALSLAKGGDD
jgi:hypothetical protein